MIKLSRRLPPRERALIASGLFLGFRIGELLSLSIGQVWRDGAVLPTVGIPPRHRKGHYGSVHWVPVGPELRRAFEALVRARRMGQGGTLDPREPLFLSRTRGAGGRLRAIGRKQAYRLMMRIFARAKVVNDGRLGCHATRKSYARMVYDRSGHDLLVLRDALGHASASTSEKYLEVNREDVMAAVLQCDWTRRPRRAA